MLDRRKTTPGCCMNHAKPLGKAIILHIWPQNTGPRLRKVNLTTRIQQFLENRWEKQCICTSVNKKTSLSEKTTPGCCMHHAKPPVRIMQNHWKTQRFYASAISNSGGSWHSSKHLSNKKPTGFYLSIWPPG